MNQIVPCDWLPKLGQMELQYMYLARLRLPTVSREKNFPLSQIINPLLTLVVLVKMAGYWPHSFLVSLQT